MPCSAHHSPNSVTFLRIGLHLVVGELRLGGERLRAVALDRAADLAIDDAGRVDRLEQLDHRRDAVLVGRHVLVDQRAGEPAAAQRHVGRLAGSAASPSGSSGKRRPFSMPVKPAERDWRRHSSSDTSSLSSDQIVVPPRDGRHAQFGFHSRYSDLSILQGWQPVCNAPMLQLALRSHIPCAPR